MAAVDLSVITGVLASLFEDRITSQLNRSVVLAQLLPVTGGQGKNIQWVVRSGTAVPAGAVIADGADVTVFNSDTKTPAVLQWSVYHDAFAISGLSYTAAMAAGNPAELAGLFAEETEESVTRVAAAVGSDLYTGTTGIIGMLGAGGGLKATGTYAGINRATVTQWAGNEILNGGTPRALTFDLMRETRRAIYNASGEKPDLIVCSPKQHEKYGLLFQNERRYMDNVRLRGQNIQLDGGYQVLEFDGIPVVEDQFCPDDQMLFLSTRHVNLKYLPSGPDGINQASGMQSLHGHPEEQFGGSPMQMGARVQPLAITGDSFKFAMYVYTQMCVKRPNACAVLGDLN